MNGTILEPVTLWMLNGQPIRTIYAGRRWRVTDMPTRIRESIWTVPLDNPHPIGGWRFQGTDDTGESLVFDVYQDADGWHVHHVYR